MAAAKAQTADNAVQQLKTLRILLEARRLFVACKVRAAVRWRKNVPMKRAARVACALQTAHTDMHPLATCPPTHAKREDAEDEPQDIEKRRP